MNKLAFAIAAITIGVLTGCGSTPNYGHQFTTIINPTTAAFKRFSNLPDSYNLDSETATIVTSLRTEVDHLGAMSWPSKAKGDIRSLIVADGPLIGDMNDMTSYTLSSSGFSTVLQAVSRDLSARQSAVGLVENDLGLPPSLP